MRDHAPAADLARCKQRAARCVQGKIARVSTPLEIAVDRQQAEPTRQCGTGPIARQRLRRNARSICVTWSATRPTKRPTLPQRSADARTPSAWVARAWRPDQQMSASRPQSKGVQLFGRDRGRNGMTAVMSATPLTGGMPRASAAGPRSSWVGQAIQASNALNLSAGIVAVLRLNISASAAQSPRGEQNR